MCLNLKKMAPLTISTTLSEIWQKAKSELELVLPREAFDEWFSNLACVGGDESKIVLGSPSAFAPYWITDNYLDILSQNLSMAAGHNISVEITVVNSPEPAAAETPAPRMARAVVAEEPKTLLSKALSSAKATSLRTRRLLRLHRASARRSTRCSFTATPAWAKRTSCTQSPTLS